MTFLGRGFGRGFVFAVEGSANFGKFADFDGFRHGWTIARGPAGDKVTVDVRRLGLGCRRAAFSERVGQGHTLVTLTLFQAGGNVRG